MFSLRVTSLVSLIILLPINVQATSVDSDMQRCASAALAQKHTSYQNMTIQSNGLSKADLDHDAYIGKTTYRMDLYDVASGASVGEVTCAVSKQGDLLKVKFES